ncbi:MAG TPA: hypothetical protein PLK80_12200 [bacterium]|nr:hypothetical protein [bacterium]HPI77486.1 hypothetical protein [bacterium]HPN94705.1 hypothetical protein [bacterium]
MDMKFQDEPVVKNIPIESIRRPFTVPRDERFQELFTRHVQNKGVELEETLVDIAEIEPFSKDVKIPKKFVSMIKEQIKNGQKPELFVYKKGEKYIMSDDYISYFAYLSLGWKRVPVSILKPADEK